MATPNFNVFEDDAIFDVIWKRVSKNEDEQTGPGEREDDGQFQVKRAPQPASRTTTQNPSTSFVPMIATFLNENDDATFYEATFTCEYNHTSRSYDYFALVEGSMSEDFAIDLATANGMYTEPDLEEVDEGIWRMNMYIMCPYPKASQVELWAKKRVDDVKAEATDGDLRSLSLGRYASGNEEEEEEGAWGEGEEEEKDEAEEEEEEKEEEEEAEEDGDQTEEHSDT